MEKQQELAVKIYQEPEVQIPDARASRLRLQVQSTVDAMDADIGNLREIMRRCLLAETRLVIRERQEAALVPNPEKSGPSTDAIREEIREYKQAAVQQLGDICLRHLQPLLEFCNTHGKDILDLDSRRELLRKTAKSLNINISAVPVLERAS